MDKRQRAQPASVPQRRSRNGDDGPAEEITLDVIAQALA
jgi:hypothetical protein